MLEVSRRIIPTRQNEMSTLNLDLGSSFELPIRVILLGAGGAGKSSLVARLSNQPFVAGREATAGVSVSETISFSDQNEFKFSFWDCAGQGLTYGLHRLFMGNRAVYLVLGKGADAEEDLEHWHNIISGYGSKKDDTPIIFVATHSDEAFKSARLQDSAWKRKFSLYKTAISIDSKSGTGIEELKQILDQTAREFISTSMPSKAEIAAIESFRLKLVQNKKLSFDSFRNICKQYEIIEEKSLKKLADYLHNSGLATQFEIEKSIFFLEPRWACEGLYGVVRWAQSNDGILDLSGMSKLPPGLIPYRTELPLFLKILCAKDLACEDQRNPSHFIVPQSLRLDFSASSEEFEPYLKRIIEYVKTEDRLCDQALLADVSAVTFDIQSGKYLGKELLAKLVARRHDLVAADGFLMGSTVLKSDKSSMHIQAQSTSNNLTIVVRGPVKNRNKFLAQIVRDFENLVKEDLPNSQYSVSVLSKCGWAKVDNLRKLANSNMPLQVYWKGKIESIDPEPYLKMIKN